ncbi:amino acid ABC transporter permease [Mitsuaria sp. CC2]|jgi:glutamate/aspartate transport system permease protein|uniref:amino acid ABC transporter permease n=1 Tax=Mitsuaria sp. CC2 TaxID=3029186 RepID=UPI00120EBED7|nr:MAG: amino acid ABC transporter permease [Rubrivivax sp.]
MTQLDFSFLTWDVLTSFVAKGLWFSIQLTISAMIGGIVLGTVLALMRLSGRWWLERPAAFYVDTLRSIPLVMVILWCYLLLPYATGALGWSTFKPETTALITFTLFEATYYSEIMRAGIQSVSKGQVYAGYAMGMTYRQTMSLVVLPQAFRNMLPVLLTQTIVLFQDTSLVYAIGAYDLLKGFEVAGKNFGRPMETYLFVAVVYFVICFSLSMLVRRLQKKIAIIR